MSDIQTRPFSKNYSGLINQSVIALGITVICVTGQELMKRRRRGKGHHDPPSGLGSKETWEFGYLYQGRSWARFPSPASPTGWPLSWVKQAIQFPEDKLLQLRGLDAAIYIRFLRGCFWFSLTHALTTFPILFPIHVEFSENSISPKSMTRASISSLVTTGKGLSLLWIHICLLFWLTISWILTLLWICNGAFKLRAKSIEVAAQKIEARKEGLVEEDTTYYQHPHPQYPFKEIPSRERDGPVEGLKLRTIMVSNIPTALRNEKDLQEYFEYYMSRKVEKPSVGLTSSTQPGFINKSFAFLFNRVKKLPAHLPSNPLIHRDGEVEDKEGQETLEGETTRDSQVPSHPLIERVITARKMTELASLLERREEILVLLETAHIKLANKALQAVKTAIERKTANKPIVQGFSKAGEIARKRRSLAVDVERGEPQDEATLGEQERMEQLIEVLGPYVEEFGTKRPLSTRSKKAVSRKSRQAFRILRTQPSEDSDVPDSPGNDYPPTSPVKSQPEHGDQTIWEALLSLPRSSLDAYQPLVNLSHLFTGKIVPSIDYYAAKLNLLTSLITENRAKSVTDFDPTSTAFVTFSDPADARRACKYLAVHPNNPLACLVTMAPVYQDVDWIRVMKSSYNAEFLKDWVVNLGVWAFTLFWLFPVSIFVSLVSIQNISLYWPSLKTYLDHHSWQSEVLQSLIPTLLVALLALLIPLILLLIAKKAHTITTLSSLHDLIMTRYYKFLIVNVLVFFCIGTAAMQTFLLSFKNFNQKSIINTVATSFPSAGPFYVGWLIFTTAMHGGFELALLGLPLIMYPITRGQVTPRKRSTGIRPRTLNYYYWLPNHCLVIHVLLLFALFNPFVLPFGAIYFFVQSGVIKNQLIHVYAKNYEGDGKVLLIRMVRYSLDGLVLSQAVFLAYMVVLKKTVNFGLAAFLIVFTVAVKLVITRMCRAQFELDDIIEAEVICNGQRRPLGPDEADEAVNEPLDPEQHDYGRPRNRKPVLMTIRLPQWINFSYATFQHKTDARRAQHRRPNPFGPHRHSDLTEAHPAKSNAKGVQAFVDGLPQPAEGPEGPTVTKVTPDGYPWNMPVEEPREDPGVRNAHTNTEMSPETGPVVSHPPPTRWDDQGLIDLPYDNPFYSRAIDNVLWLPRNPSSVLDLDDTVDLKVAITVDKSAGRLGSWLGIGQTASPQELSRTSTSEIQPSPAGLASVAVQSPMPLQEFDGTEEIDLPLVIAKRVQAGERDVERTLRPRKSSMHPRKSSYGDQSSLDASTSGRRRGPSVLERTAQSTYRSFSAGSSASPRRGRSGSIMSTLQVPHTGISERTHSSSDQVTVRPDAHAQADFVAANNSASRISLSTPKISRSQNVSAAQAIFHEVLEEERQALQQRIEDETAEAEKTKNNKSWLTSWLYWKEG